MYTAGLFGKIAPQDTFKSPVNSIDIQRGATEANNSVGYNKTFIYPVKGLDELIRVMVNNCSIEFNKKIVQINVKEKTVTFSDSERRKYKRLISTLPLNKMLDFTGIRC